MAKQNRTRKSTQAESRRGRGQEQESSNQEDQLHELFLDELADIYSAEQQLVKAMQKFVKAAESEELREAFETHIEESEQQISRLEEVADALGENMKRKTCKGMQGLIAEAEEILREKKNSPALDAAIIAAAQEAEHYEIASYGTLCAWAEQMGEDEALDLLRSTLDEEEATDHKLTEVAETIANQRAESA